MQFDQFEADDRLDRTERTDRSDSAAGSNRERDVTPRLVHLDDRNAGTNPATRLPSLADRRSNEDVLYRDNLYDDQRFFGQPRCGRERFNEIGPINDDVMRRRNEGL